MRRAVGGRADTHTRDSVTPSDTLYLLRSLSGGEGNKTNEDLHVVDVIRYEYQHGLIYRPNK